MNNWIRDFSIKWKLIAILSFSSFFSLLLAALFLFTIANSEVKQESKIDMQAMATLIANRSTAAIMFNDNNLALENLQSLHKFSSVIAACIYSQQSQIVAHFPPTSPHLCPQLNTQLKTHIKDMHLFVYHPISEDEDNIGMVYIHVDLNIEFLRKLHYLGLVLSVLFLASVITFLLSIPFLQLVSMPLTRLLKTVHKISQEKNYALRAVKINNDELGDLVDAFNEMIHIVELQNRSLTIAKDRYLTLYNDNPTMVFNLQLDGTILSVNYFGAKQLYLTAEELQGRSIYDFVHLEDRDKAELLFTKCIAYPQQVHKQEIRKICRDSIIWVRETARLITDDQHQQNVLLVCEDVTEARTLSEKIAYQAAHDSLTGLLNRHQFDTSVQQALIISRKENVDHALCYLDLDQFKVVNDTCGHLAGDELLKQLGELLYKSIRKNDVLARLGGDEFGVLMYNCSLEIAFNRCEKLRNLIKDFRFGWESKCFTVGVSIGIAPINHYSGNAVDVLKEADSACYAAKEKGRNRVHIFTPDDEDLASRQGEMQWVEKIHDGIENNKFCLYGQLIIPLSGIEKEVHFETLIRYRDEQDNIIPPGAFLSAAERYNIASELDRWVIEDMFSQLAEQPQFLQKLSLCSINLSGLSLSDNLMQSFIEEMFQKYAIPQNKICFEITETAAIASLTDATKFIEHFKQQGCAFSLDDFGSGLSSFAYLKSLPVDFLKIDGLFVKDIIDDKIDLAMVRSINEVGHVMGKKTIAEFVEDDEILYCLKTLGVDYAQGYGIKKPIPISELIQWASEQ